MHKTTYRHTEKEEGTSAGEMAGAKVVKDGSPWTGLGGWIGVHQVRGQQKRLHH